MRTGFPGCCGAYTVHGLYMTQADLKRESVGNLTLAISANQPAAEKKLKAVGFKLLKVYTSTHGPRYGLKLWAKGKLYKKPTSRTKKKVL
jgi:hypothetical protein